MDDRELRDHVIAALDWEPSIDSTDIGVTIERGVVTLAGHVPNYLQRGTAERVVKRLKGVKGFVQKIEVRPAVSAENTDENLALRAVSSLAWNVLVPKDIVQVEVKNGWVTLNGEVEWNYQRQAAEASVAGISGVRGVNNTVRIRARPQVPDVKKRIEDALKRDAEIEAKRIQVDVHDGQVTLRGKVDTLHELDVLKRAVWSAPGVRSIDDHLIVQ